MHKLFKTSHEYLYTALKRSPKLFIPNSHLHNPTKTIDPHSRPSFVFTEPEELESSKATNQNAQLSSETREPTNLIESSKGFEPTVHISHPWPEWVDLMECLIKRGYFDGDGIPFNNKNEELDSKEANCIRTAGLNFGRDQYSLIRFLSKKDILMVVGCGCPSIDRKVVNSGKRLREHVGIDEGNVCSCCNLRGNCERAFVKAREDKGGRTVDVMRILLTYGLDPITGTVENKPCLNKMVKEAVRRLLKQMVEYGSKETDSEPVKNRAAVRDHVNAQENNHINAPMKQGDWRCPKCNFLNFARNIRCLRCDGLFIDRLKQQREDQDHLPLKKGDWICDKCSFLNFAKNARCRQCKENPPKRQLNPGEWECESCNYINFRRNMVCLKCDHKRPKASNASDTSAQPEHGHRGNFNHSRLKLLNAKRGANYCESVGLDRQSTNMWSFAEKEREDDNDPLNSWNEISGSNDVSILGDKGDSSQNLEKGEKFKLKISKRDKTTATTRENGAGLFESTDDEMNG